MKILILGWGSLIWDPRKLHILGSHPNQWALNGPVLPLEFSRISSDGRLTLVIDDDVGELLPTFTAQSSYDSLAEAVEDLRSREKTNISNIGYTDRSAEKASTKVYESHANGHKIIVEWIASTDADAVIWTALVPNYPVRFTPEHAADYLQNLSGEVREKAFEYITKAPYEVMTRFRQFLIEKNIIHAGQADGA